LAVLVREADAADLFAADDITVFAPDNDAFDVLPSDVLAELRTRPDLLRDVLANHVVDDDVPLAELGRLADLAADDGDPAPIATTFGDELDVARTDGAILVGDAALTDGDLVARNGRLHVVDRPLLPAGLDLRALEGLPEFVAVLRNGRLDLTGSVPTADDRTRLIGSAVRSVAPANVSHDIDVDPAAALRGTDLDVVVELVGLAPSTLTSGSVGFDGNDVFVRGTAVDDDARAELAAPGAVLELDVRPPATASDVADLRAELDDVLATTPLSFAPASAELDPASIPVLDVIASLAKRFDGVAVLVEGYTDTVGDAQTNLALSELRAAVVHLELVARGVPDEQLDHAGRGGADPVVVDGVEDRAASRRVELVVSLAG
jgi:outer membrane protein OmpA-like peptidoglycan-associated protein